MIFSSWDLKKVSKMKASVIDAGHHSFLPLSHDLFFGEFKRVQGHFQYRRKILITLNVSLGNLMSENVVLCFKLPDEVTLKRKSAFFLIMYRVIPANSENNLLAVRSLKLNKWDTSLHSLRLSVSENRVDLST